MASTGEMPGGGQRHTIDLQRHRKLKAPSDCKVGLRAARAINCTAGLEVWLSQSTWLLSDAASAPPPLRRIA